MNATTMQHNSNAACILVASADALLRRKVIGRLQTMGDEIVEAQGGADALGKLETSSCRLLLIENPLPDLNTDEFIQIVEKRHPGADVLLIDRETGEPQVPSELRDDKLYRRLSGGRREAKAAPAIVRRRAPAPASEDFEPLPGMIGSSERMRRLTRLVRLVARKESTVLITGETGVGKELVASALHRLSPRANRPFVAVNCAAIPETLLEAELFGHARGAFTGAVNARVGKIQTANGGSLFLDEIGEMPSAIQAKLLRFLQDGEVQRLGSSESSHVDVRVIAATNAPLEQMVARREFREDLYYRLAVFPIELPPLRSRGDDILMLAEEFLQRDARGAAELSDESRQVLMSHRWPGNVRELQHVMERAVILADGASTIEPEHLCLTTVTMQ